MPELDYPAQPEWLSVDAQGGAPGGLEPALADVVSHLADKSTYRDGRHITWCHETTHGINAVIRNQRIELVPMPQSFMIGPYEMAYEIRLPRPAGVLNPEIKLGNVNGCYCLGGRGLRLTEPSFKLADVANAVPSKLQGMSFQLYLVQQRRYWDDMPLYVLDELASYLNGLTCGVEGKGKDAGFSDVLQPVEFVGYAWTLFKLCTKGDYPLIPLRNLLAYQTARAAMLLKLSGENGLDVGRAEEHWEKVLEAYLPSLQIACGLSWCERVFFDRDFEGIF